MFIVNFGHISHLVLVLLLLSLKMQLPATKIVINFKTCGLNKEKRERDKDHSKL